MAQVIRKRTLVASSRGGVVVFAEKNLTVEKHVSVYVPKPTTCLPKEQIEEKYFSGGQYNGLKSMREKKKLDSKRAGKAILRMFSSLVNEIPTYVTREQLRKD